MCNRYHPLVLFLLLGLTSVTFSHDNFQIVDESYSDYVKKAEVLNTDSLEHLNNTQTTFQGWTITNCSLLTVEDIIDHSQQFALEMGFSENSSEWKSAQFLEPKFSMQDHLYCAVSRTINAPQNSSVRINFYLLVHGKQNASERNKFIHTDIDFKIELSVEGLNSTQKIGMEVMNVENDIWKHYQLSFRTEEVEPSKLAFYSLRVSEEQHVILRNISLSWAPILDKYIIRPDISVPETTTAVTTNIATSEMNSTTVAINSTTQATPTTVVNSTTESNSSSVPSNESITAAPAVKDDSGNGSIGYSGEVFLIILVVVLIIGFSAISTKYYFLHKNIGAYRVSNPPSTTSSQYSNPSFQENYRDY